MQAAAAGWNARQVFSFPLICSLFLQACGLSYSCGFSQNNFGTTELSVSILGALRHKID
jgi:hypothetical protein